MNSLEPIKYFVEIAPVREVTLLGTIDLPFWREHLRPYDLVPAVRDGKAQAMIVAVDSKFNGIRFRELSISIVVDSTAAGYGSNGAFLVQAFNSVRFFAFVERNWFQTPYVHSDLHVNCRIPAAFSVNQRGRIIFGAQMSAEGNPSERVPLRNTEECWEGPIFLPRKRSSDSDRLFFGRLRGQTRSYTFDSRHDRVTLDTSCDVPVLQALIESHFSASEWQIRENGIHAKSKTIKRPGLSRS